MTIIFLARRFYPLIGGVEKHVYELSRQLNLKGHKIIVITEKTSNISSHEFIKSPEIEIYRINGGKEDKSKKFRLWQELWKLKDVIKNADVIHCHDVFFWYMPFRFYFWNKPVYTTFHGYESYPVKGSAIRMRKISEKLSYGNICIGDFIKKWYKTKPSFISYGAVDLVENSNKKVKKDSALFIGRLDDQTGIITYTKALEQVKRKFPKFSITAYGDGKYKNRIAKKIIVKGFQKNPEKYLSNFHFAFVSRYLAILEAFAAKRLVFAVYDNPIKEDYLRLAPFAKYMIIAKDHNELAKKVIDILNNSNLEKEIVEGAYNWSRKQTWEKLANTYLKLWKQ